MAPAKLFLNEYGSERNPGMLRHSKSDPQIGKKFIIRISMI